ncbi:hypothetical protein [Mucilaginibacter sp. UR6-11]|uniref:hypothetical protein n=1 Tax=Mucilaginibacter sp. UR6-11 TaxID=1435644 RepID=UPI001E5E80D7|nr:hypothetical protein [Mucilaginibacter sp. UR6-11]MCC8425621.1 hypothetical protein [Mucilaginibacter sp. UR6-11]
MSQSSVFMPQRQFHVLVNDANEEQNLTVLPGTQGNFKVIKQGEVLGEVSYTPQRKIVCYKGRLKKRLINQLEKHITNYYWYAF